MALYVNRNDVTAEIDAQHLLKFMDDNKDGVEDAGLFNALAESVDNELLGIVAALPSDVALSLSSWLRSCGKYLFCSLAYRRKGAVGDANPYEKTVESIRQRLDEIQSGDISFRQVKTLSFLTPARTNVFSPSVSRIENFPSTTPSYTANSGELILTAEDGKTYKMVAVYSGSTVTHKWEEVL